MLFLESGPWQKSAYSYRFPQVIILINISNRNYNHCCLSSPYHVLGKILEAFIYTIMIPILQMKKMRHREIKPFNQSRAAYEWRVRVQTQTDWFWHLCADHHVTTLKTWKSLLLLTRWGCPGLSKLSCFSSKAMLFPQNEHSRASCLIFCPRSSCFVKI